MTLKISEKVIVYVNGLKPIYPLFQKLVYVQSKKLGPFYDSAKYHVSK